MSTVSTQPFSSAEQQRHSDWTDVGSDATAKKTLASLRKALEEISADRRIEVFLQGSYANSTNIRADSDVDVVVKTSMTYSGNATEAAMHADLRSAWDDAPTATYSAADLRRDVVDALAEYYGPNYIEEKNKCIKVLKRDGYLDADVVPCIEYRHYTPQARFLSKDYIEGVLIHAQQGGRIVNFPKEHRKNGSAKNARCNKRYKPSVRQIKRLRNEAIRLGRLDRSVAPGYLLECMVYNAPTSVFKPNDSARLREIVSWLTAADLAGFSSCDRVHTLFGSDPGGFTVHQGAQITSALSQALDA